MKLKNLTPHPITLVKHDGTTVVIAPESVPARVSEQVTNLPITIYDVPLTFVEPSNVTDLPPPESNVTLIVSRMVLDAAKHRADLVSPGALVRDSEGRIVGCAAFIVSSAFIASMREVVAKSWEQKSAE